MLQRSSCTAHSACKSSPRASLPYFLVHGVWAPERTATGGWNGCVACMRACVGAAAAAVFGVWGVVVVGASNPAASRRFTQGQAGLSSGRQGQNGCPGAWRWVPAAVQQAAVCSRSDPQGHPAALRCSLTNSRSSSRGRPNRAWRTPPRSPLSLRCCQSAPAHGTACAPRA